MRADRTLRPTAALAGAARERWVGVGRSEKDDATDAGREAAEAALRGDDPRLLVVFCSERYALAELTAAIREWAPHAPLVGCSTAGEIAGDGAGEGGVVVAALGGDGLSVATAAATGASSRLRGAGEGVAACLEQVDERPHRALLLLTDGLAGDQQEILRGVRSVAGAGVPLVGGCAGDDLRMRETHQLHGGEVLVDGVVAAAIASDAPLGVGHRHGWRAVGEPMLVTRSAGNRVQELNGRPALDVYLDALGAPDEPRSGAEAFTRFALRHPLGLARRAGEAHVRFVAEADLYDRSLGCIAHVPEGALVRLMEGDVESVLEATDAACRDALAALGGHPPRGLLAFDCVARRAVLGADGVAAELERLRAHAGGAPIAGFHGYGEIARTRGVSGFHNQTLAVLAIG